MGKDSLIKSTAKKQAASKEKDEAKKTATAKKAPKAKAKRTDPKKATKAVKKAAPKKKAPKKKARVTTPKAKAVAKPAPAKETAKKKAAAKPTKKTAPPKKKPSIKELLMKKFDSQRPAKAASPAADAQATQKYDAPPFFTGLSDDETQRLKALLLKKFDLEALPEKAPAQPTESKPPEADAEPVEKSITPEPAAATETPKRPPEPEPVDEFPPPLEEEPADPAEKILKYMAGAFAFLVLLVIGASFINQGRYYLNSTNGAVEIWQGKFAPKGQKLLVALPGAELPEVDAADYTKQDVYPIAFNYYIDKADAILDVPGAPNFDEVKVYLETALAYAASQDLRDIAYARLNNIDFLILMYKADVAGSRGTIASLEAALAYLAKAKHLANALQAQQLDQKIDAFSTALASLQAEQAAANQLEADKQALEQTQPAHE